MSEFLSLTDRFSEGALRELSFPPTVSRRGRTRGDVNAGSSSPLHNKRRNGHTAVAFGAFVSVLAILFLLSHCRAFSREALQQRVGRRLAGEKETNGGGSAGSVAELCGGEEPASDTAAHSRKRSPDPSWGDPLGEESEDDGEPLSKMWHGGSDWQQAGSPSPFHDVDIGAKSAEDEEAALELPKGMLPFVEKILSQGEEGFDEDDWLRLPFEELEFFDEQEGEPDHTLMSLATGPADESETSGITAVVTGPAAESASSGFTDVGAGPSAVSDPCGITAAVTGPPVGSATSGSTGFASGLPEDDSSGSASPGEGSTQSSNLSSGETVSPLDAQITSPSPGGTNMQSVEPLHAAQGESKTAVLFEFIIGQPGSKGAYMIVGSEISDPQGRISLKIVSYELTRTPVAQQSRSKVDVGTHPFFRLPSVGSDASVRDIVLKAWPGPRRRTLCESASLLQISKVLKKPFLDSVDLEVLMEALEKLVEFSIFRAQESIDTFKPKEVAAKLGFELLMLDAMFAASEVIGAKARRADWWQNVIDKLPVFMGPTESALSRPAAQQNISLIRFLDHALQFYQLGLRPPASLLVPLKQVLLCTSAVPPFTKGPWAKFRNDDTDWHQSQ